jgi:hypothetical protein
MKKLKILWNNRNTWRRAFDAWYVLMFPHLYYAKFVCENNLISMEDDAWLFWEAINNHANYFDDEDR